MSAEPHTTAGGRWQGSTRAANAFDTRQGIPVRASPLLAIGFFAAVLSSGCGSEIVTPPQEGSADRLAGLSVEDARQPAVPSLPASVEISPTQATVERGGSVHLTATVKDASGLVMTGVALHWSSDDPAVAAVSPTGLVVGVNTGTTDIRASAGEVSGSASVSVIEITSSSPGIWIGKDELDQLAMAGDAWAGKGEVLAVADGPWTPQPIERQSRQAFHVEALAGALVYARLAPLAEAAVYRSRVAEAIATVIAFPPAAVSVTAPSRHLGTWAITADLIDLAGYDPMLDAQFRAWLRNRLDHPYSSSPASIRAAAKQRPNNIGSWARFSLAAASVYLGDTAELDELAGIMRFWLGDRTALPVDPFFDVSGGWDVGSGHEANSWQEDPDDPSTWRGIVAAGVRRDGNRFDGIQPQDHWRGSTGAYKPTAFPGVKTDHRYPEQSLAGTVGAILILQRAGYDDLLETADRALLRAARSIRYFAKHHQQLGYEYFTGPFEASRPLLAFLYPEAHLPVARVRTQYQGRANGFAWTYWTHGGRSLR
jgi:hypothetical protein